MVEMASLAEVCAVLRSVPGDRVLVTQGRVIEVHRVRGSCYFTLAPSSGSGQGGGDARLSCALLRRSAAQTDFWVTVGQVVDVTGYAECFRDRWQLRVVEARLVRGAVSWPRGYRRRSARRIVMAFDALLEALLGPSRE